MIAYPQKSVTFNHEYKLLVRIRIKAHTKKNILQHKSFLCLFILLRSETRNGARLKIA